MTLAVKGRSRLIDIVLTAALAASGALPAFATETHQFDVPAEDAPAAIRDFASQAHVQILVAGENVKDKQLHAVSGEFSTDQGLRLLLADSGLAPHYVGDRSIAIVVASSKSTPLAREGDPQPQEGKKSFWDNFRLAQANQGSAQKSSTIGTDAQGVIVSSENSPPLTEILVTAQKRTERQQDVPIAMTVLDPQTLAENGQNRLMDYFATVPGLSLSSNAQMGGTQYVTIRGLSAGFYQNPTVATVIDDVPVGSSQVLAAGSETFPDLDPSDLARIEVLRGPQGTLYGADSLGGLIKYVTADPSTSKFSGRAEVAGVDIPGGGTGYAVRAAANIPLSDTFAIRISGFSRRDPGYIDDLTTGLNNINSAEVYGGHFAALYRPSDSLSLKLSAMIQNSDGNGPSYVNSNGFGLYPQGDRKLTGLPGTNAWYTRWQLYTATLNAKLAGLDITSVTGYGTNTLNNCQDLTGNDVQGFYFGGAAQQIGLAPGLTGAPYSGHYYTEKFTQEIRVSSSVGKWFDWLAGAFYTHESSPGTMQHLDAANLSTGAFEAVLVDYYYSPQTLSEHALFGDLTFHLTDRFDLQVGGRQSWNDFLYDSVYIGPGVPYLTGNPSPDVQPTGRASGSPFTYLVTPKFAISPDLQVYARFASGYRIGGPNIDHGGSGFYQGIPAYYEPDKTINYELGVKGDVFEHHLSFDAAAYYISWKNFQIGAVNAYKQNYTTNAGDAKSEGLELSIQAHPVEGLTLGVQGSYNNAVLTQNLPPAVVNNGTYGLEGDPLPYSIRTSAGLTVNQDIHLSGEWVGFLGGAVAYVGRRPYEFTSSEAARAWMPGYTQFDLRTGVRSHSWLVNLYVNNVADRRGVIGLFSYAPNIGNTGGWYSVLTQPRTVGLNVAKNF